MTRCIIIILSCCAITLFTTGAHAVQTSKMSPNLLHRGKQTEELHLPGRKYREGAKGMPVDKARAEKLLS